MLKKFFKSGIKAFNSSRLVRSLTFWHDDENISHILDKDGKEIPKENYNGFGTLVNEKGEVFEGGFQNGLKHGSGTYEYANGDTYDGPWENDMRNGIGVITFANNDDGFESFKGEFNNDDIVGDGDVEYARSGNFYNGRMTGGKEHGFGQMKYFNGDVYEGEFKFGMRHGEGTYISNEGITECVGKFKQNEFIEGTMSFQGGVNMGVVLEGTFGQDYMDVKCTYPNGFYVLGKFDEMMVPIEGEETRFFDQNGNEIRLPDGVMNGSPEVDIDIDIDENEINEEVKEI